MTWAIGTATAFFVIGILLWRATINATRIRHLEDILTEGPGMPRPYDGEADPEADNWPGWARRTLADIWTLP